MCLSNRLVLSEFTNPRLKQKLKFCGTYTANGIQAWCRSPMCDRCRRYRARWTAGAVADWTTGILASHRVQMIEASTGLYCDPADVFDEVDAKRRAFRRAYDHQQRQDDRWADVQQYAFWSPRFDGVRWSASMNGVVYLGRIGEVRFLNEVGDRYGLKLKAFDRCLIHADVRDHMTRAITCGHGVAHADDRGLAAMAAEIDRRSGFKALLARRGMQGGQA